MQRLFVRNLLKKGADKTMADYERKFDKNKIHSVELNLLDG